MEHEKLGPIANAVEAVAQSLPQVRERPTLPDDSRRCALPLLQESIAWVPGGEEVLVTRDLDYGVRVVPAGFRCNGTSVPRVLWAYEHPFGRALPAAILHDHTYVNHGVARMTADFWFRSLLLDLGIRRSKVWMMWLAVRAFGWAPWFRPDPRETEVL